jgi:hypothetical protein
MRKDIKKVVTIATTGIVTATNIANPALVAIAEDTDKPVVNNDNIEETNEVSNEEAKNQEQSKPTLSDIGVLGELKGNKVKIGEKYYSNNLVLHLVATSLKEGVTLDNVDLFIEGTDSVLATIKGGSGDIDLPNYEGSMMFKYHLSDGTVLEQKAEEVLKDFATMKTYIKDSTYPKSEDIVFSGEKKEFDGVLYFMEDGEITIPISDDGSGINKDSINVTGAQFVVSEDCSKITINTKNLKEGKSKITLKMSDMVGNAMPDKNYSVNMYREAPVLGVSKLEGTYSTVNNKTYVNKDDELSITFSGVTDKRFKKIELKDKSGNKISDIDKKTGKITIGNGDYRIYVQDIVGQEATRTLEELTENKVFSTIQEDESKPEIGKQDFSGESKKGKDGNSYIISDGEIRIPVSDSESGIESVKVSGAEYSESEGVVVVNTNQFKKDGSYNFKLSVKDRVGNLSEKDYSVRLLREFPEIKGNSYDNVVISKENSYSKKDISISLSAYNKFGIDNISVLKDNIVVGNVDKGTFSTKGTGRYSVKVVTVLGDERIYTLEDLFKEGISSNIVLDSDAPSIDKKISFSGSLKEVEGKTYLTTNGEVSVRVSETGVGVNKDTVVVKDKSGKVKNVEFSYDENASVLKINTTQFEDGDVNLAISVSDKLGNSSDNTDVEFSMFREVPEITGKSHGKIVTVNGKSYISGDVDFSISGTDSYKVKKVELYKDGAKLSDINSGKFSIKDDGIYKIRVTSLINEYKDYTLENLFEDVVSTVVVDKNKPTQTDMHFTGDTILVGNKPYFTSNGDFRFSLLDDGVGLDKSNISVKGVEEKWVSISENGDLITINSEGLPEGNTTISLSIKDKLGNTFEKSIDLYMHRVFPEISGKNHSDVLIDSGKIYIDNPMSLSIQGYDSEKITKIELLKNNKVISEIKDGKFSIEESGVYEVRVTDLVSKTKEYKLSELFSDLPNTVVVDKEVPVFKGDTFSGDKIEVDNVVYYTKDGDIVVSADDNGSGISKESWKLSGVDSLNFNVSDDGKSITTHTADLAEGPSVINIEVSDKLGHKSSYKLDIYMHRYAPEITGKTHSNVVLRDGISYINKNLEVSLSGTGSPKVKLVELYKDGKVVDEVEDGTFAISESGEYTVRVVDLVNNAKVYRLEDLFKDITSNVVVDKAIPECNITINDKEIDTSKWVTENGVLKVKVSDSIGLSESVVTVNGKKFTKIYEGIDKDEDIVIDLKTDVPRAEDGKYKVSVKITDIAGNTNLVDTKTLKVDFDKPKFENMKYEGTISEDKETGKVFFKGDLNITGSTSDIGSGIDKIELMIKENKKKVVLPLVIKDTGNYTLRVYDKAGLYSDLELKDILGTESNNLVSDNVSPTIERVSGFKEDIEKDGKLWFKTPPVLKYKILDTNIKSVKISINGEEKITKLSETGEYILSTEGYECPVTVNVEAIDKIGNKTEDAFNYFADFTAPTNINVKCNTEGKEKHGIVFFKENPQISVSAEDAGIGVDKYILSGDLSEENVNGNFTLKTGSYFLEVSDILGNTSKKEPLGAKIGYTSNNFIVDSESPSVSFSKRDSDYENWYNSDVEYKVNLKDNVGLDLVKVFINGQEVSTFTADKGDISEKELTVNTNMVQESSNGMYEIKVIAIDNAGNIKEGSDVIYIDRTSPVINKFVFTGDGYAEGNTVNGTDRYGFFFNGAASCDIYVSDGTVSSGLKDVHVTLESKDGSVKKDKVSISNGVARVNIPKNFKGYISAYADDNVGNKGDVNKPDGVITEDHNYHINSTRIDINLPKTEFTDISGIPLYPTDVSASASIGCDWSGLRNFSWGIGENTLGSASVDLNGDIAGDVGNIIKEKDKNLIVDLGKNLSAQGNANGLNLWVKLTDRTGHSSEASKVYSIDKDAPTISVSYDNTEEDNFYNRNRVATITVHERNFDPSKFTVSGSSGVLGSWSNNGEVWVNTISFTEDKDYNFSLDCIDRAGNKAKTYTSENFTVDKTAPKLSVSWDVPNPSNENYFNSHRTATITVVEHNFDSNLFKKTGSGVMSGWSSNGDVHTATVSFNEDGEFEFGIEGTDKAGNASEVYNSGKFNIDATLPKLSIEGVEEGISYKEDIKFSVNMSDDNIDSSKSSVELLGRKSGNIRVSGAISGKSGIFTLDSIPKEELYDDVYTLKATVTDKAGNVESKNIKFSVNRFGSKYTFLDADILGNYIREPKTVVINETNVDKLDTSKARVRVIRDGSEVKVSSNQIGIKETGGDVDKYNYSYSVDKSVFDRDGKYIVQVYSHALEGTDYSSVSEEYAFILDSKKPEIIISGLEDGKTYKDYKKKITIDIRDKSKITEVSAILNGKSVPLSKENGIYTLEIQESKNKQSLSITVKDKAGNESTKSIEDFIISSEVATFIVNQWWFKWGIGAIIAFLAALIALIVKSRRDSRRDEEISNKDYEDLYNSTAQNSSESVSTEDRETTIIEDEEK